MTPHIARPICLVGALAAVALAASGCGEHARQAARPTVGALRACLDRTPVFSSVRPLPPGQAGRTVLAPRDRGPVVEAARGADAALIAQAGGPRAAGGTIVEAPVRIFELFRFADPRTAAARGAQLQPAVGRGAFDGARSYGRWLGGHSSFGIGDRAARAGLTAGEMAPVVACLRSTGSL